MLILNINGPINAGKTTVSKLLVGMLKNATFIEVDNLLSNTERRILGLTVEGGWTEKLNRLDIKIDHLKSSHIFDTVIFAFPITERYFQRWKLWEDPHDEFMNITLSPRREICLSNRSGNRELNDWEIKRINEMYDKGINNPPFANLIVDNSNISPEETAEVIKDFLGKKHKIKI